MNMFCISTGFQKYNEDQDFYLVRIPYLLKEL